MKPPYYYIDGLEISNDQVYTISISYKGSGINMDPDHYDCVRVLGSNIEATERAIKILKALNHVQL